MPEGTTAFRCGGCSTEFPTSAALDAHKAEGHKPLKVTEPEVPEAGKAPQKLVLKADAKRMPALYETDAATICPIVIKFFDPTGSWSWYAVEGNIVINDDGDEKPLNQATDDDLALINAGRLDVRFFGLVDGHEKEVGYFMLGELQKVRGRFGVGIERDAYFDGHLLDKDGHGILKTAGKATIDLAAKDAATGCVGCGKVGPVVNEANFPGDTPTTDEAVGTCPPCGGKAGAPLRCAECQGAHIALHHGKACGGDDYCAMRGHTRPVWVGHAGPASGFKRAWAKHQAAVQAWENAHGNERCPLPVCAGDFNHPGPHTSDRAVANGTKKPKGLRIDLGKRTESCPECGTTLTAPLDGGMPGERECPKCGYTNVPAGEPEEHRSGDGLGKADDEDDDGWEPGEWNDYRGPINVTKSGTCIAFPHGEGPCHEKPAMLLTHDGWVRGSAIHACMKHGTDSLATGRYHLLTKSTHATLGKSGNDAVYEKVTARIIEALEAGKVPWRKPWHASTAGGFGALPRNLVSNKPYRGANVFFLALSPYTSPYWLTMKQANDLGGHIKAGEKATPIMFWAKLEREEEDDDGDEETRTIMFARSYNVWNLEQTVDVRLPAHALPPEKQPTKEERKFQAIEAAETVLANYKGGPPTFHDGGDRAFYIPAKDEIHLPKQTDFDTPEHYYTTRFHECTHSTGHKSRLDRGNDVPIVFGSKDYSKEELVAEFGAAFLAGHCGIDATKDKRDSPAYIQGWLSKLKGDRQFLVSAASQGQKAADHILGIKPQPYDDKKPKPKAKPAATGDKVHPGRKCSCGLTIRSEHEWTEHLRRMKEKGSKKEHARSGKAVGCNGACGGDHDEEHTLMDIPTEGKADDGYTMRTHTGGMAFGIQVGAGVEDEHLPSMAQHLSDEELEGLWLVGRITQADYTIHVAEEEMQRRYPGNHGTWNPVRTHGILALSYIHKFEARRAEVFRQWDYSRDHQSHDAPLRWDDRLKRHVPRGKAGDDPMHHHDEQPRTDPTMGKATRQQALSFIGGLSIRTNEATRIYGRAILDGDVPAARHALRVMEEVIEDMRAWGTPWSPIGKAEPTPGDRRVLPPPVIRAIEGKSPLVCPQGCADPYQEPCPTHGGRYFACHGECPTCAGNGSFGKAGCHITASGYCTAHGGHGPRHGVCDQNFGYVGGGRSIIGHGDHGAVYAVRDDDGRFRDIQRQDRTARAEAHSPHAQAVASGHGFEGDVRGKATEDDEPDGDEDHDPDPPKPKKPAKKGKSDDDSEEGHYEDWVEPPTGTAPGDIVAGDIGEERADLGVEAANDRGKAPPPPAPPPPPPPPPAPPEETVALVEGNGHEKKQPTRINFGKADAFDPDTFQVGEDYEGRGFHAVFAKPKGGKADTPLQFCALIFPPDKFTKKQAGKAARDFAKEHGLDEPLKD